MRAWPRRVKLKRMPLRLLRHDQPLTLPLPALWQRHYAPLAHKQFLSDWPPRRLMQQRIPLRSLDNQCPLKLPLPTLLDRRHAPLVKMEVRW